MTTSTIMAWIISFVVMVVMLLIATTASNLVSFQPDRSDVSKRKVWFWVCFALTLIVAFLINFFCFAADIYNPVQRSAYLLQSGLSAVVAIVIYLGVGILINKSTNGKLASWFN